MIPVALVDDDEAYAKAQVAMAAPQGFAITWFKTWAQAKGPVRERRFMAVILDAKGQIDEHSPTEDIDHLTEARRDLDQWRGANIHIPYVINTGFDEGTTRQRRDERRYLKGNEKELYAELKGLVDRSNDQALRDRYADVFAVLQAPYLDAVADPLFMDALRFVDRGDRSGRDRLFMNPLRQVIEYLFLAAHKQGLLPNVLVKPVLNQRLSAAFLAGQKVLFPSRSVPKVALSTAQPLLPKLLASALENVLNVTNWGSHAIHSGATAEDTNFLADNEEAFREHGGTPYLLSTVLFQLMDILVFFKRFVDEHPDPKVNSTWIHEEPVGSDGAPLPEQEIRHVKRAIVVRGSDQTFAHANDCYIHPGLVKDHGLQDGDLIDLTVEPSTKKPGTFQAVTITKH